MPFMDGSALPTHSFPMVVILCLSHVLRPVMDQHPYILPQTRFGESRRRRLLLSRCPAGRYCTTVFKRHVIDSAGSSFHSKHRRVRLLELRRSLICLFTRKTSNVPFEEFIVGKFGIPCVINAMRRCWRPSVASLRVAGRHRPRSSSPCSSSSLSPLLHFILLTVLPRAPFSSRHVISSSSTMTT